MVYRLALHVFVGGDGFCERAVLRAERLVLGMFVLLRGFR